MNCTKNLRSTSVNTVTGCQKGFLRHLRQGAALKSIFTLTLMFGFFALMPETVLAVSIDFGPTDNTLFQNIINWILGWVRNMGVLVAVWGVVQIALAFYNQSAEGKINGLAVLVSGGMLIAVSYATIIFG